jgi:hypothetical protein
VTSHVGESIHTATAARRGEITAQIWAVEEQIQRPLREVNA